ncbi:MAG: 3-mercaptopyruvate sulfurtransferase [Alphaproteobacteria bacterium]|nr:3-mercaptopyruvate sulfurtransferase [Alphaproteobacteria bacterium]
MAEPVAPLVSTAWLAQRLGQPGIRVLDASWYMPTEERDPKAEHAGAHIPGAVYFDIDAICERTDPLPHMFPTADQFARDVGALGVGNDHHVIAYDGGKMTASARCWWMFRAFGHARASVLDGGLHKWRAEGRPLEAGAAAPKPARFEARPDRTMVKSLAEMRAIVREGAMQILDARSAGRFAGSEPEPRAALRGGHMPGAHNLPYVELLNADGTMKDEAGLRALFARSGVETGRPIVTTCGSGVSAAVLLLGLERLGARGNALYDGSWTEWGGRPDTPIVA